MSSFDSHIARWLLTCPGPIYGATHEACLRSAWAACSVACDVATFTKVLFNRGFAPTHDARRKRWLLALPEPVRGAPLTPKSNAKIVSRGIVRVHHGGGDG
jgi:hypothetical protein